MTDKYEGYVVGQRPTRSLDCLGIAFVAVVLLTVFLAGRIYQETTVCVPSDRAWSDLVNEYQKDVARYRALADSALEESRKANSVAVQLVDR